MQNPSELATYGAPFSEKWEVEDPTTDQSASQYNRHALHTIQMSQTTDKVYLRFPTVAAGNSTPSQTRTHWGDSVNQYPTTVTRTGVGAYTITYPSTMDNQWEPVAEAETVSFIAGRGHVASTTVFGHVQVTASGAVLLVVILDGAFAPVDLTAGTSIDIWAQ